MKFKFNRGYFLWFILLLAIEMAIALFLKTGFIRNTFGDFLAVILLYCLFKSFWNAKPLIVGISALLIAFGLEFLQLFNILEYFDLDRWTVVKIILGSTFHIGDLLAYTLGTITVLIVEYKFRRPRSHQDATI